MTLVRVGRTHFPMATAGQLKAVLSWMNQSPYSAQESSPVHTLLQVHSIHGMFVGEIAFKQIATYARTCSFCSKILNF